MPGKVGKVATATSPVESYGEIVLTWSALEARPVRAPQRRGMRRDSPSESLPSWESLGRGVWMGEKLSLLRVS